ncbi:MAG: type II toxin-antitoxin system Phd/YefM family antitoxin, partial [Longimicrobiales bacterium]|nr:type II toxin-antitoxin system Phd/YefM family antitoxin [Longimicrobiales bacterium]
TISVEEFQRNAERWIDAVRSGETLVLTHRGEAVARLEPIRAEASTVRADDPLLRVEDFAVVGAGGSFTDEEIDGLVYGT